MVYFHVKHHLALEIQDDNSDQSNVILQLNTYTHNIYIYMYEVLYNIELIGCSYRFCVDSFDLQLLFQ